LQYSPVRTIDEEDPSVGLTVPHIPIPIDSTASHSARLGPPPERIVSADAGVY